MAVQLKGLMKLICKLTTFAFVGIILTAQNAQMVLLKGSDTQNLKEKYKVYMAAKADWEKSKEEVVKQYKDIDWGATEFSKDFKIAIPYRQYSMNPWHSNNITLTPATGSYNSTATSLTMTTADSGLDLVTGTTR